MTGATGSIGRQLVRLLHERGEPVVAMCRRSDQVLTYQGEGVESVLGDLGHPDSLSSAMAGCDRVFLLTAAGPDQHEHGRNGVEAAAEAGVDHLVHLSTGDANPNSAIPWANAPAYTDVLVKQHAGEWTILRPTAFMQNLLLSADPIKKGYLPQTSGRGAVAWIDTADVAKVAATVLTAAGHHAKEYYLTGPELLSMPEITTLLSAVVGHPVRYAHLPGPLFFLALRAAGLDSWTARGLVHQFVDVVRRGHDFGALATDTVKTLTADEPRSLREFLADHRAVFTR